MNQPYDVVVIGGGINGCGCAMDAASRGLSVLLCEKDDLASKTSSSSTKLIHGGLRYLEQYDFNLVKKALHERQMLLNMAPHLVHPLAIVLPYQDTMRPMWILYLGLLLYDSLSRDNQLPASEWIRRKHRVDYFLPLTAAMTKGFLYYDGSTDDARLTVTNAMQARQDGAVILTHTALIAAKAVANQWQLTLQPKDAPLFHINAKTVINAAGPWVTELNHIFQVPVQHEMSLVKGSHIVIHQLYQGEHAYLLQHDDKRVVFVIPYHGCTLIGTTDVPFSDDPAHVNIDEAEVHYLCELVNRYFTQRITPADIICSWSGVRPLLKESGKTPANLSRDYVYELAHHPAPLVTIYGGKITTYRQLASEVIDSLGSVLGHLPSSHTSTIWLPGAKWHQMSFSQYQAYALEKYHWLDDRLLTRYLQNYGTHTEKILADCRHDGDLGMHFMASLYQKEVDYLCEYEWAQTVEDILWRRTKLGLVADPEGQQRLALYLQEKSRVLANT